MPLDAPISPGAQVQAASVLLRQNDGLIGEEIAALRLELFLGLREVMGQNGLSQPPASATELVLQLLWFAEDPARGLGPSLDVARLLYPEELLVDRLLDSP